MKPSGPTNNSEYNNMLVEWAKQGKAADPSCEECGADLTMQDVHEGRFGWYCSKCWNDPGFFDGCNPEQDPTEPREYMMADEYYDVCGYGPHC